MTITVELFATLRQGRFVSNEYTYREGLLVSDILDELNINKSDVSIIFVNCRHSDSNHILKRGDKLALFPPVGGG